MWACARTPRSDRGEKPAPSAPEALGDMTKPQLREEARRRGVSTAGTKAELFDRLSA